MPIKNNKHATIFLPMTFHWTMTLIERLPPIQQPTAVWPTLAIILRLLFILTHHDMWLLWAYCSALGLLARVLPSHIWTNTVFESPSFFNKFLNIIPRCFRINTYYFIWMHAYPCTYQCSTFEYTYTLIYILNWFLFLLFSCLHLYLIFMYDFRLTLMN